MGNSQFSTSKDGGDDSREDGPYSTLYAETQTAPGPSGFAPDLHVGNKSTYTDPPMVLSGNGGGGVPEGADGDEMDVESKTTDDGEEDEVGEIVMESTSLTISRSSCRVLCRLIKD